MPTTTSGNLALSKPDATDKIKAFRTPYNSNMDKIDETVTDLQDGLEATDGVANAAISPEEFGIVVNGNKSSLGAEAGQYIVLRNSTISGCADGLYKAAQAIPANTAINATYLTAVPGGGLNALNASLVHFENLTELYNGFNASNITVQSLSKFKWLYVLQTFALCNTSGLIPMDIFKTGIPFFVMYYDPNGFRIGSVQYVSDTSITVKTLTTGFNLVVYGIN